MPCVASGAGQASSGEAEHPATSAAKDAAPARLPQPNAGESAEIERKRRKRLWYLAIKPPMYSVCIIPVLVRPLAGLL